MSEIENDVLDQYGTEPFKQQQFGTAGVEGVNVLLKPELSLSHVLSVQFVCSF